MKRICSKCNKDLENATVFHIVDDQYICSRCYDFYHQPKYNELDFDNLRKVFRKEQNQKAIESLKRCEYFIGNLLAGNYDRTLAIICEYIDGKIKELEGDNERK